MKLPKNALRISLLGMAFLFLLSNSFAQTKQLKRPKSKVGVYSVDNFVTQSFDLYDKVHKYNCYAAVGTPLNNENINVLEKTFINIYKTSKSQLQTNSSDKTQRIGNICTTNGIVLVKI